ncbi:hypothetical protein C4573_00245 [Candidatus Woesearchaeota archaeon]|nr:MAG: hypothetical protein C4573_00245 [Candidatus Woesearchaeota archaeon]
MKVWLLLIFLCMPVVSAQVGHINLVSVGIGENDTVTVGSTPDLYLEIKPGNGNIYMDSLPLTKVDTQISTRYANAVACDFLQKDCSKYDFFYTFRLDSNIVGGPSGGAAITVLTIAMLDHQSLRKDTIMTGTINAGGLIGPVAGIREKAIAAKQSGFKRMLIPSLFNNSNITFPENIEVITVTNLEEAMYYFTGKNYTKQSPAIDVPDIYTQKMFNISEKLCNRYQQLDQQVDVKKSLKYPAEAAYNSSEQALQNSSYYSRASFCYTANVRLRELQFQGYSQEELEERYYAVHNLINKFDKYIDQKPLNTLSDLETFMIVKERIIEARQYLEEIDTKNISASILASATERYYSGVFWSDFYGVSGKTFEFEKEQLRESCLKKIEEASERVNYADLYFPNSASERARELALAYHYSDEGNYDLCLFKASKVKADTDMLLTALFVEVDQTEVLLNEKLQQTEKVLALQQSRGNFPILGYSYYQYAQSLKESDPYSALIYLEYAIELSNLDMYFPPEKKFSLPIIDYRYFLVLLIGFLGGMLVMVLIKGKSEKYKQKKYKKKKAKR